MNTLMLRHAPVFVLVSLMLLSLLPVRVLAQDEQPTRIIFMHHSTGQGLIDGGAVRDRFTALGYEFWDHGYNADGLTDATGARLDVNWDAPDDNTDPDGWAAVFSQPVTDPAGNTFSHMLEFDVIIFKSCFPASDIQSEEQFEAYRSYFLTIRDVTDQHPDRLFVAFTPPPLVPNATTPEAAARARRWAAYLASPEYLDGHPNIVVFDFFSLLSDERGYLRAEYRADEWDSHPNELANRTSAPLFVDFVHEAVQSFTPGEPALAPLPAPAESTSETAAGVETLTGESSAGLRLDFESGMTADEWWTYTSEGVVSFGCAASTPGHESEHSLELALDINAEGNAGCGTNLLPDASWSGAQGIAFYWRADQPDLTLRLAFGVREPGQDDSEPTPFEIVLTSGDTAWSQVVVGWDAFHKPDWFGDAGVGEFDPANVVWIGFDVGEWETAQTGSIWIDDIRLIGE